MDGDSSDILGGPTLPKPSDRQLGLPFAVKSTFLLVVFLVLCVVGIRVWDAFLLWREKAYKLAMRRRHGIPDNDHRPFNVAYAAVVRARQEREASARRVSLQETIHNQQSGQNVRHRHGIQHNAEASRPPAVPGRFESIEIIPDPRTTSTNVHFTYPAIAPRHQINVDEVYNPNPTVRIADPEINNSPPKSGPSRRPIRKHVTVLEDEQRKRGFDGDESDGSEHPRTKRNEVGGNLRGDAEQEWYERFDAQRGSKRVYGDDDDTDSIRAREKRQRKVSLEKTPHLAPVDMEIDEDEDEDEVKPLRSYTRGKKRDRAEAGSTFGGDDDESTHEAEMEDDSTASRRHRKRRTYAKRKSDVGGSSRGQKRDRGLAEDDSDVEDEGGVIRVSRKKRGKRFGPSSEHDGASDISMDETHETLLNGRSKRNIGDEWENNGIRFKVGPRGQRLRQTLVKKARQKFHMPIDSQHPDRQANLEVYIETWLTEEEYREAKEQQLLAWQDSNKPSAEPQTPLNESQELPPVTGKDLLWKSTSGTATSGTATPRQTSPPTPHLKQEKQLGPRKRISSIARPATLNNTTVSTPASPALQAPSLADSTNGNVRQKLYSKWEKQDLEARAMMKMREANRLKEEKLLRLKLEKQKAEKLQAATVAPQIPTITVTNTEEAKPKQPEFVAAPSATDTSKKDGSSQLFTGFPKLQSSQTPKVTDQTSPSFPLPPQPQPATASSTTFPAANTITGGSPLKPSLTFGPKPGNQQAKPSVLFAPPITFAPQPAPTNAAPVNAGSGTASLPSPFPFASSAPQLQKQEISSSGPPGGSLMSRVGPAQVLTSQPSQTPSFSSTKPLTAEVTKPASIFGNPSTSQTTAQSTASRFAQAQTTTPQSTPPQQATATSAPKFSFAINKPVNSTPVVASSSSLSGALGNPAEAKPAASTTPMFNFKAAIAPSENAKATDPTAIQNTNTHAASGGTAKFGFAPSSMPTFNMFGPTGAAVTPVVNAHPSSSTPAQSGFTGFGTPSASSMGAPSQHTFTGFANTPLSGTSPSTTSAPGQSAFAGFSSTPASGLSNASAAPGQSAFGGFGAMSTSGTSSNTTSTPGHAFTGFGTAPNPLTSAFPTTSQNTTTPTSSPFGTSNIFGNGASSNLFTKTAGEPKTSAFPSGNTATTPSTPVTALTGDKGTAKPKFSFGALSSTPSAASIFGAATAPGSSASTTGSAFSQGGFAFGGDAAKSSTTTPQTTQPGQSIFGKPSGPSAFGFGAASGATTSNAFSAFGKAPASTGQQQQ